MARRSPHLKALALLAPALGAALALGCQSIGPGTVARDRYDYSNSISESWKRQTLLNIVKLRYLDPPIFVDVGQIVAGYSLETGVSLGGQVTSPGANSLSLAASGKFTDRPTITYTPLTGNKFLKALMTPLPPSSVFFMIQSGWPADGVLMAAASSINGLKNQETSMAGAVPPDPDFLQALGLFRKLQRSGAVAFRLKQDEQQATSSILTFRAPDIDQETLANADALRRLLRLDPAATEFELVFGGLANNGREVAVITRSLLHIMSTMAAGVEVPEEDMAEGRAAPGLPAGSDTSYCLVHIHSSASEPDDASVAVQYRGHWFWVDDRDLASKRAFAFMLMLFTLANTGEEEKLPLITIPAQ